MNELPANREGDGFEPVTTPTLNPSLPHPTIQVRLATDTALSWFPPEGCIERVGVDRFVAFAEELGVEWEPAVREPEPLTIGGLNFPRSEGVVLARRRGMTVKEQLVGRSNRVPRP